MPLIDLLANSLAYGDSAELSALAHLLFLFSIVEICITHTYVVFGFVPSPLPLVWMESGTVNRSMGCVSTKLSCCGLGAGSAELAGTDLHAQFAERHVVCSLCGWLSFFVSC